MLPEDILSVISQYLMPYDQVSLYSTNYASYSKKYPINYNNTVNECISPSLSELAFSNAIRRVDDDQDRNCHVTDTIFHLSKMQELGKFMILSKYFVGSTTTLTGGYMLSTYFAHGAWNYLCDDSMILPNTLDKRKRWALQYAMAFKTEFKAETLDRFRKIIQNISKHSSTSQYVRELERKGVASRDHIRVAYYLGAIPVYCGVRKSLVLRILGSYSDIPRPELIRLANILIKNMTLKASNIPRVVNVRKEILNKRGYKNIDEWMSVEGHLYVGRNMSYYPALKNVKKSKWYNPFRVSRKVSELEGRKKCTEKYEAYIRGNNELMNSLPELLNLTEIGCWCSPRQCHASVLVKLLRELEDST